MKHNMSNFIKVAAGCLFLGMIGLAPVHADQTTTDNSDIEQVKQQAREQLKAQKKAEQEAVNAQRRADATRKIMERTQ